MSARNRLGSSLGRAWREYTRMRTAIYLLIVVAVLVMMGGVIPQDQTSTDQSVQTFLSNNTNLNSLTSFVGLPLTGIFVSPLFYTVIGLLYISLGACVLRRFRALVVRTVRHYSRSPQFWGEWGSWVFHAAFLLLVVAAVYGKATGFQGLVSVTTGQSFTETRSAYDSLQEGLLYNGQHAGYEVHLNSFSATYQDDGEALQYQANTTLSAGGKRVSTQNIFVNQYLAYDDTKIYLMDYGWAPQITVRDPQGNVVYDGYIQFVDSANDSNKAEGNGVLKVPDFGYTSPTSGQQIQLGAELLVIPDAHPIPSVNADGSINPDVTDYGTGGETARNPVIMAKFFIGNLGLNHGSQNVNALDTQQMEPYFSDGHAIPILMGQNVTLPLPGPNGSVEDFTVSFADLHQYAFFMVAKDNGVPFIYLSFFLIMAGLLSKLYMKPFLEHLARKRAAASDDGSAEVTGRRVGELPTRKVVKDHVPSSPSG